MMNLSSKNLYGDELCRLAAPPQGGVAMTGQHEYDAIAGYCQVQWERGRLGR